MWKTRRPRGVVVSSASVRLRNAAPLSRKASTVSISWRAERARRSSFQTTSVSPSWTDFIASNRAGRSIAAPETCSVKIFFASGFGQRLRVTRGSDRQWQRRDCQPAWSGSGWRRSPSTLTVRIQFEQTARLGPGGIQQVERRKSSFIIPRHRPTRRRCRRMRRWLPHS
jgi:hypothetical protein